MLHLCSWSNDLFEPFEYLDSNHNKAQTQASSKFCPRTTSVFSLSSTSLPTSTTTFSPPIWNPFLSATGAVLSCLRSYLSNRHQFIITSSCTSSTAPLSPGIPSYHHSPPLLLKLWSMLSSRQELTAGAAFYTAHHLKSQTPIHLELCCSLVAHPCTQDHIALSSITSTGLGSYSRSLSSPTKSTITRPSSPTCSIATLPPEASASLMSTSCPHHSGPGTEPGAKELFVHSCPLPLEASPQKTSETAPTWPHLHHWSNPSFQSCF